VAESDTSRGNWFAAESVPANYQELLAPVIFEPWAEILLKRAGVGAGSDVLDVACGTGVLTRRAAASAGAAGRVVALDLSAAMLAHAATIIAPGSAVAPIEYVEGSATELPFEDASFDRVICQQGLQFFPDKPAALAEFHRVLRPGGTVTLAVWDRDHRLEPFEDYTEALATVGADEPFPGAFDHDTFTIGAGDLRTLISGAGFQDVDVSVVTATLVWPEPGLAAAGIMGTPFAPLVHALDPADRTALQAELLARFEQDDASEPTRRLSGAVLAHATHPGHV
jgi:SAM-dependent methyltransferase